MADQYNRQLHPDEIPLLKKQADSLAKEARLSPAEAEKRLAEALVYYTDKDWNGVLSGQGAAPDALTVKHLGIALAPLGATYAPAAATDVPATGPEKTYTPTETAALIANYSNTHAAQYADNSINVVNLQGFYAGDLSGEYANFYRKNLAVSPGLTDWGTVTGSAQGTGKALSEAAGSAWALLSNPVQGSEQIANGLVGLTKHPVDSLMSNVEASQTKAALATLYDMQGNTTASAAIRAQSDVEFALNFLPVNRVKTLAKLVAGEKRVTGAKEGLSVGEGVVQSGDSSTGLLSTQLAKDAKSYLTDIQSLTGRQFTPQQLDILKADLRENSYSRLSKEDVELNRVDFEKKLPRLRKEWEKNTGESWPKETYTDKNGSVKTRNYDAHHVIENKFGGKAEWWNITPAMRGVEHQGGIHRAQGPAEKLFGR